MSHSACQRLFLAAVLAAAAMVEACSAAAASPVSPRPVEQAPSSSNEQAADAATGFLRRDFAPPLVGQQRQFKIPGSSQMLHACLTRPPGGGRFPAVIYNHGSEADPPPCGPPELVRAYVEHGYMFLMVHRTGHGLSPGPYVMDQQKMIMQQTADPGERAERIMGLHDDANRDVVAAVAWLMRQPYVDRSRVVMTGVSFGGIQTLITAEKNLGIRAFVPFAPGAQSWGNEVLRQRLEMAVGQAQAPIFLAQAWNDFSLGPSNDLGPIVRAKGAPNTAIVYPPFGTTHQQGHGGFAVRGGVPIWSPDVFAFLHDVLASR